MELGIIGLGKMGLNIALNLSRAHRVVAFDRDETALNAARAAGLECAVGITELANSLSGRKVVWLMVPAGAAVDAVIAALEPHLNRNDIIIDGGNSRYTDSMRRHAELKMCGIDFIDCGTSGGVEGALSGACTMVGGESEPVAYCEPIFHSVSVPGGYLHTGGSGSGHFTKMVHNGIEYGMMQSVAEGFELLANAPFELNLERTAALWNHGSVIRGWLMELTASAFAKDARLDGILGRAGSSGEGQWTVETALELGVPVPVIALSLMMRQRSQTDDSFAAKLVAALRNEFGGHSVELA